MWGDTSLWFWFAFPWWLVMLNIFSCVCWPSICLLWKNVYSGPLPIFNWVVCVFLMLTVMSYLYILDINLLVDISFANIFSYSVSCLFVLSMCFAVQVTDNITEIQIIMRILWTIICQQIGQPRKNGYISRNIQSFKIESYSWKCSNMFEWRWYRGKMSDPAGYCLRSGIDSVWSG